MSDLGQGVSDSSSRMTRITQGVSQITHRRVRTPIPVGRHASCTLGPRMFESLSDRFDGIFGRLRSRGRLNDDDVDEVLREIRVALLEADVNFTVVKTMVSRIRERTVGEELSKSLTPAQQVIKIVHEELIHIL